MSLYHRTRVFTPPTRGFWCRDRLLLFILVAALILRLFVLFTEGDRMFLGTDDDNYRESAEILLHQGILTYAGWHEPTVFIMPGYPIVLAAVFAAVGSTSWLAARLIQVGVSLVALWFAVKLGTRLGGRWVGIVSGALLAVYPPNLTSPSFLLTETIFTCLLLMTLYYFARAEETGGVGWFALTGLVLGLSVYFRPTSGLLPFVFGVYLLFRGYSWKKAVFRVGIMGAVVVICLSPWIVRNYLIYREFIPFTVSGGNPFLRGTYINGNINEKFPWVEGNRILSDKAQMEYGKKRLVEGFRTNFRGYLYWYTVGKLADFWGGPFYYKELTYLPAYWVNLFHRVLLLAGTGGLLLGLWRRKPLALLFLLVSGYFTFLHLVYLTGPRYSYPVVQLAVILAAYLIAGWAETKKTLY
ncbi:MAG: glycosyltransferase family 39 protein [Eubacteriales bacterium]|nr:glycosyltransferase family 39 protein [Bacillota bacterium]